MGKDLRQSIKGLAGGIRNRELKHSDRIIVAKVTDISPLADNGFIICTLEDGTYVNVHAWTSTQLGIGQTVAIAKVSAHAWNTYFLMAVNASTDTATTPYTPPQTSPGSLAVHQLAGDRHTGALPWSRIDTSGARVNLAAQVTGQLPLANQVLQLAEQPLTVVNQAVAAGATATGAVAACRRGLAVALAVAGGASFTLTLHKDAARTQVEYQTVAGTVSPFGDPGIWYHAADASTVYWTLENTGGAATFVVTATLLVVEP